MSKQEVTLGGCYHTGLAYALGYEADGETELDSELFTNLDTGIGEVAMASLMEHRRQFNPHRDVKRFIVALKPVKIIYGLKEDEDYKLEDNAGCDKCGIDDRVGGCFWCQDCIDEDADTCSVCGDGYEDCYCDEDCDEDCNEYGCYCHIYDDSDFCDICSCRFSHCDDDNDELDQENIADTFHPLNAFARERWIMANRRALGKL